MQIEILNVSSETKPTSKGGTYVMLDVAFKNLSSGKTEGKKLVPFGDSEAVYKQFKDAKAGNQFDVTLEKQGQYWVWTKATSIAPGAVASSAASKVTPVTKSTYETPEERAKKQVYIVKQSSISNAVAILTVGAKTPPSLQSVLDLAQQLTSWVFTDTVPQSLQDMPDDLTFDEEPQ